MTADNFQELIINLPDGVLVQPVVRQLAEEIVPDTTEEVCARILAPPTELPCLADLKDFLHQLPSEPLPLLPSTLSFITCRHPSLGTAFTSLQRQPAAQLCVHLMDRISHSSDENGYCSGGKQLTMYNVQWLLVSTLLRLDEWADAGRLCLGLQLQLGPDVGDESDSLAAWLSSKRALPSDIQLRSQYSLKLLYKGECQGADGTLNQAVEDLFNKTQVWTPLYYGSLPYLLTHAAAGQRVQFYAIPKTRRVPVPISRVIDISQPYGRASLMLMAVQLHRLLAAASAQVPETVLPVGNICRQISQRHYFTRTLFFRADSLSVLKMIEPFSFFAEATGICYDDLSAMYEATSGCDGLVHAVCGSSLQHDCYSVELQPLGLHGWDVRPTDEGQMRTAARGLLLGLKALHAAGFVHRDIKWANIACDLEKGYYFWLDLEMAGRSGPVTFMMAGWREGTLLEGQVYTHASDVFCLGQLMSEHGDLVTSEPGRQLLQLLLVKPAQQCQTAEQLLQHPWFQDIQ